MRTRAPEHASTARAKVGLAAVVILVAGLATSAWPAHADGSDSSAKPASTPASSATASAKGTATTPSTTKKPAHPAATTGAQTAAKTAAKPAATAPAGTKPGSVAAAKPATAPASTHTAAKTNKPAATAPAAAKPGSTAPVAAAKPASVAPAHAVPMTTKPTAMSPAPLVKPGQVAPVAASKPGAASPKSAPAAGSVSAAKPGKPAPASGSATPGLKTGATVQVASHGSIIVVTPQAPSPSARPASGVGAAKSSVPAPQVDEQVTYQYNTLGRRDPFQSMIGGDFVGEDVGGDAPIDVGGMKVVGVVWSDDDKFALVEDGRGGSHVLRRGDKVMNGFVEDLKRDGVVVNLTTDGTTQSVTIPLIRKGDKNASR
jgi:hypothetical protein